MDLKDKIGGYFYAEKGVEFENCNMSFGLLCWGFDIRIIAVIKKYEFFTPRTLILLNPLQFILELNIS